MNPGKLFVNIKFVIAQCSDGDAIKSLLIEGGAKHINYLSEHVTVVITNSDCPEAEEAVELYDKPVVTSLWVYLSIKAQRLLPMSAFSPSRRIFERTVIGISTSLSKADVGNLAGILTYYGAIVSKDVTKCTHYISVSADGNEISQELTLKNRTKIIAPDWVLDSVKAHLCQDEHLYTPSLLLPPPPAPPVSSEVNVGVTTFSPTINQDGNAIATPAAQKPKAFDTPSHTTSGTQLLGQQHRPRTIQPSQLPRPRLACNVIRGMQPKFKPILPDSGTQSNPRPQMQSARTIGSDNQPKKVTINYSQYRDSGPYANNIDMQQPNQMQTPHHPHYHQVGSQIPIQTPNMTQHSRLPQPNVYHHNVRPSYQNSHINPQGIPQQQQSVIVQQHQRPTLMINRFQDPKNQPLQRPYQACSQPQQVNPNYQQNNANRQPIYFTQSLNQVQIRVPQQGPMMRPQMQSEQSAFDNFAPNNQEPAIQLQQQHYPHPNQSMIQSHQQQQQPSVHHNQQSQTISMQPRNNQCMIPPAQTPIQIRPSRTLFNNQPDQIHQVTASIQTTPTITNHHVRMNHGSLSHVGPQTVTNQLIRVRSPNPTSLQPHPSIFDNNQDCSLAKMRAKVPNLNEPSGYLGYESKTNLPDTPLLGCSFKLIEHDDLNVKIKLKWTDAIEQAGGIFKGNLSDVTHLICETRSTDEYKQAIRVGVRCVTIYWINDVLRSRQLDYPWKALHLPLPFSIDTKPLKEQIISMTNLRGRDRRELKDMILKTGARYTEYFGPTNTLLICGSVGGEKYDRAIEWKVPIANCHLITDFLLRTDQTIETLLNQSKYQLFSNRDLFKIMSYADVREVMQPWLKPIIPQNQELMSIPNGKSNNINSNSNDDSGIATCGSNHSETDTTNIKSESMETLKSEISHEASLHKIPTSFEGAPLTAAQRVLTQNNIKSYSRRLDDDDENKSPKQPSMNSKLEFSINCSVKDERDGQFVKTLDTGEQDDVSPRKLRRSEDPVRIIFTHLDCNLVKQLEIQARDLGLGFASHYSKCTHLVVDRISRTSKFLCALNYATYIISHEWITESHQIENLLDEKQFLIQDDEGEKMFSVNLAYSLLKRQRRSHLLFKDMVFFITPTVITKVSNVKEMIESASGVVSTRKFPSRLQLSQMKLNGKRFVVITCEQDLHLCASIAHIGVDLLDVEFVISGLLRQDIDYQAHRITYSKVVFIKPNTTDNRSMMTSPPKKSRTDSSSD